MYSYKTVLKEISNPEISLEKKMTLAIHATKLVCSDEQWNLWADRWLNDEDRTRDSAYSLCVHLELYRSYNYRAARSVLLAAAAYNGGGFFEYKTRLVYISSPTDHIDIAIKRVSKCDVFDDQNVFKESMSNLLKNIL